MSNETPLAITELHFRFQAACLRVQQAFDHAQQQGKLYGLPAYETARTSWQVAIHVRNRIAFQIAAFEHPELVCAPGMVTAAAA